MTSTYNEPLITSEWAVEVFKSAKAAGLVCSYVSNGNGTAEVLDYIRPWVSLYKVDLKSFRDRHYRDLGGTLERVLWTIRALHAKGFWLEVVTLVVPGFNDSRRGAQGHRALPGLGVAGHPVARDRVPSGLQDGGPATARRCARCCARPRSAPSEGLRFVYAGNLPGAVGSFENTYCPGCRALLVERLGYRILQNRMDASGLCPDCRRAIPGRWA